MQTPHTAPHRTITDWILATRPWSFPASSMPVIVTTACVFWLSASGQTTGHITWTNSILALAAITLIHAAGNMWSDLNDYTSGVDTPSCHGVKTLLTGRFTTVDIRLYSLALTIMAAAIGAVLAYRAGLPVLAFGITGILLSLSYPLLKYHALGDLDIFLCYALLPTAGTSYILTGHIISHATWIALPLGLITVAILHINNTRDIRTDSNANIHTFAMIIGHSTSLAVYAIEVITPFAIITLLAILKILPVTCIAVCIALPIAISNIHATTKASTENPEPIATLDEKTAQLQLTFSLLLSLAFLISPIIH